MVLAWLWLFYPRLIENTLRPQLSVIQIDLTNWAYYLWQKNLKALGLNVSAQFVLIQQTSKKSEYETLIPLLYSLFDIAFFI